MANRRRRLERRHVCARARMGRRGSPRSRRTFVTQLWVARGARLRPQLGRKGTPSRSSPPTCRTRRKSSQSSFARWRSGAKVVWAVPQRGSSLSPRSLYYAMLRRGDGMAEQPLEGGDVVLIDRSVAAVLIASDERHSSLFARIRLAGFEQANVSYRKEARHRVAADGPCARNEARPRLAHRLRSCAGARNDLFRSSRCRCRIRASSLCGRECHEGEPPTGWSSIMVAILILGGGQMIFLGVLGEYAWRTLDETRSRPLYVVETSTDDEIASVASPAAARH